MRGKAEFKALREMVGMTQAALAGILGVEVRSVKRWESDDAPQQPPADAWDEIDRAMDRQRFLVSVALSKVDEIEDEMGCKPEEVVLPYWSSAAEYGEYSTDAAVGVAATQDGWRMANASNRALAAILLSEGVPVRWVSGKDNLARK